MKLLVDSNEKIILKRDLLNICVYRIVYHRFASNSLKILLAEGFFLFWVGYIFVYIADDVVDAHFSKFSISSYGHMFDGLEQEKGLVKRIFL